MNDFFYSHPKLGTPGVGLDKWGLITVPADGVKGKTWGPSTCHQRERGQIPLRPPLAPRPGGIWSKSAPNLDKSRNALSRTQHEIGNTRESANPDTSLTQLSTSETNLSNNNSSSTTYLNLIKNKLSAISCNALGITDFKPFRSNQRNNSFPNNALSPRDTLSRQNRLSRSIGNITESHYEAVFETSNYVIARGIHLSSDMLNTTDDDTEKLIDD